MIGTSTRTERTMKIEQRTACTVVSSPGPKNYFRMVADGGAEEVTLPLTQAGPQHRSYILATWVRSYAPQLRKWLGSVPEEEGLQAEKLWDQSLVVTDDDGFTVHAWVCGSPGLLHYVYVPPELRRKGVAEALIKHLCGHTYEYGRPWPYKKEPNGGKYNPYILGRGLPDKPKGGV